VLPNSYWLYQSNRYDTNLPFLQDGQCGANNRSTGDDLVLLRCTQPSALFDGIIGQEIKDNPKAWDLLVHYTWQAGIVRNPFIAMTFDPPLEVLANVTLYLYREVRLDVRAPYIRICASSSATFTPCTEVLMWTRPDLSNGVLIYDFSLQSLPTPILFLKIAFVYERGPGDTDEWIFVSEMIVNRRQQQTTGL